MEPRIYIAPEPFQLETGHTLPELKIAYHTYGELNAAHDNVVWVCHALTANSDVADWWPHTVETGKFLDPARHFVVCANILGSHYGTTGPLHTNPQTGTPYYRDFPPFTIRDIVRAHILLADALGIGRIGALVGSSVGGFQAVEWAVTEPQRIGKLVIATQSADLPDLDDYIRRGEAHGVTEEAEDIASCSLIENWIDETERRTWFLFEATRQNR